MEVTKPAELRQNQKEYLQKAYEGEVVLVVRPRNENVVILNNALYSRIMQERRIMAYFLKTNKKESLDPAEEGDLAEIIGGIFDEEEKEKSSSKPFKRTIGDLADHFKWIADDFDDCLEGLEDYI